MTADIDTVSTTPTQDTVLDALRDAARRTTTEAYLVGGFVRDRLLGRPGKDIDLVCVDTDGVAMLTDVATHFGWHRPQVFERFGTAQIRGEGFIIESVRARAESYLPESRKPSVRPGTLAEDIVRRDFTCNALCQSLSGELIDITGHGIDDLRAGILRTPLDPAETFSEDPLRMFRAARFVAQLGFTLADGTVEAMRATAERSRILSVERINEELRRLLTAPKPSSGLEILRLAGLLDVFLPEIAAMIGIEQGGYHIYDVYGHTLAAVDAAPPDPLVRLGTLLHDVGKPPTHVVAEDGRHTFYDHPNVGARMATEILRRLRFSNEEIDAVSALVRLHLRPIQYDPLTFGDSAIRRLIREAGPLREAMLAVARADTTASSYPDLDNIEALAHRMDSLDEGGAVTRLEAPLDGAAIMKLAGRPEGRWVGGVKTALVEAVLDGELAAGDADGAEAWLIRHPDLWRADDSPPAG